MDSLEKSEEARLNMIEKLRRAGGYLEDSEAFSEGAVEYQRKVRDE